MPDPKSEIRPVDFIKFVEDYLNEVHGGGDLNGAHLAASLLYRNVRCAAPLATLFYHGRMRWEAGLRTYRAPDPEDPSLVAKTVAEDSPSSRSYYIFGGAE